MVRPVAGQWGRVAQIWWGILHQYSRVNAFPGAYQRQIPGARWTEMVAMPDAAYARCRQDTLRNRWRDGFW